MLVKPRNSAAFIKPLAALLAWTRTRVSALEDSVLTGGKRWGISTIWTVPRGCRVETSTLSMPSDSFDELVRLFPKKGISGKACLSLPLSWGQGLCASTKNELFSLG